MLHSCSLDSKYGLIQTVHLGPVGIWMIFQLPTLVTQQVYGIMVAIHKPQQLAFTVTMQKGLWNLKLICQEQTQAQRFKLV